jgi:hypothetical protein
MKALMHKMAAIEATGILGIDLSWLNANYQRAMFHYVGDIPTKVRKTPRNHHY